MKTELEKEQQSQRKKLYDLLGDLPDRGQPLTVKKVSEQKLEYYVLETLTLGLNGMDPVPAYFVKPLEFSGALPTVLFNHSHGGRYEHGKEELIKGNTYMMNPPYAEQLTKMGYAALAIDHWGFGERRGKAESEIFKEMLWRGQVMWGMMVFDSLRAVDYLLTRDDVDGSRIATLGMSMGSNMAWWTAALDTRIKLCVDICCLTDYQALIDARGLNGHGLYYYVPSLLKHFTTSQINALIAPRPHLGLAGNYDLLTPPAGLDRIDRDLRQTYQDWQAADAWSLKRYPVGHVETAEMRQEAVQFLRSRL